MLSLDKVTTDRIEREQKKEKDRKHREHTFFFRGLLYGLVLGIFGNVWASFLIKILEFDDISKRVWERWFFALSLFLFGFILLSLIIYALGYYFPFEESKTVKGYKKLRKWFDEQFNKKEVEAP